MNNTELDHFIKTQAQEAEKEFKARLEGIVDDWQDKSSGIINTMYDLQQQFNTDVNALKKNFSEINSVRDELRQQSDLIIQRTAENAKTIITALSEQREKSVAFYLDQNNKLEKISVGLELQTQNNHKTERQLNDFLVNQSVQLNLAQSLIEKHVEMFEAIQQANQNIEKNESALLSLQQQFNTDIDALKKAFSVDINTVQDELGQQSEENAKTIINSLSEQREKSVAFNQTQINKLEKISAGLELQSRSNQKTEDRLNDFLANQSVQLNLAQSLLEKHVEMVEALHEANQNIKKNESALLSTNQMLSSEVQALKNSIFAKMEADTQSVKNKMSLTFGWTIMAMVIIIVMLCLARS